MRAFVLFLIFSFGCSSDGLGGIGGSFQVDRGTFLNNVKGEYKKTLTNQEGTREFSITVDKVLRKKKEVLALYFKVDGQTIRNLGYEIPQDVFISSNQKIKVPFGWKLQNHLPSPSKERPLSPKDKSLLFVYIDGTEYFLAATVFRAVKKSEGGKDELFFSLEKAILWKTGFTPPPFKKKYIINFQS